MDIGDFNLDAVNDILSTLSESDVEKLSSMASQLFSSDEGQSQQKKEEAKKDEAQWSFPFGDMPFDTNTVMKIMKLMNKMKNQPEDQRIKLLNTLRPMLSAQRRHKVDEAVQMLRIMAILPLLKE